MIRINILDQLMEHQQGTIKSPKIYIIFTQNKAQINKLYK